MTAPTAAIDRLQSTYNGAPYDPAGNAGGLDGGGHVVNFVSALRDMAAVGGYAASVAAMLADLVASGHLIRSGAAAPAAGLGRDGDFYIDRVGLAIYGPKTAGAWGVGTSLVGPPGAAATVTIGSVATGEPGAPAEVTMSGTPQARVLHFVLPRGERGEMGRPLPP